jgi:Sec-independent protein secretion pathway component TatC
MSPGLFKHEFKILKDFLFFSYLFLFLSFLLFNSFILPKLWQFFFEFQNNKSVAVFFEAKVTHYVNFYIYTFYNLLIICQVFVCMFFFFKTINYKVNFLKKTKKLYYLLFVIFATLGSPPDVLSQLFLSFSFIFTFEFIIFVILIKSRYTSQFVSNKYNYNNINFKNRFSLVIY